MITQARTRGIESPCHTGERCERRSHSASRTSCASTPSCGRRCSRTRRWARCTPPAISASAATTSALFDAMLAESEAEWDAALAREQPRFAVLYEDNFNYLSKMCLLRMREAAFAMIDMARERGCTVIVAGSDATDHAEPYLDAGADYVLHRRGRGDAGRAARRTCAGRATTPLDAILGPGLSRRDGQLVRHAAPARHEGPRRAALPGLGPGGHRRATARSGTRATATTR